jgi:hypothetical protein
MGHGIGMAVFSMTVPSNSTPSIHPGSIGRPVCHDLGWRLQAPSNFASHSPASWQFRTPPDHLSSHLHLFFSIIFSTALQISTTISLRAKRSDDCRQQAGA